MAKGEGRTLQETKGCRDYFDRKKQEYVRTHDNKSPEKPKERQKRLKEGNSVQQSILREIPYGALSVYGT